MKVKNIEQIYCPLSETREQNINAIREALETDRELPVQIRINPIMSPELNEYAPLHATSEELTLSVEKRNNKNGDVLWSHNLDNLKVSRSYSEAALKVIKRFLPDGCDIQVYTTVKEISMDAYHISKLSQSNGEEKNLDKLFGECDVRGDIFISHRDFSSRSARKYNIYDDIFDGLAAFAAYLYACNESGYDRVFRFYMITEEEMDKLKGNASYAFSIIEENLPVAEAIVIGLKMHNGLTTLIEEKHMPRH